MNLKGMNMKALIETLMDPVSSVFERVMDNIEIRMEFRRRRREAMRSR